jgi:hypothetical protein
MPCIAPSLVLTSDAAREMGLIAEALVAKEYSQSTGRVFFPLPPAKDFFDISHGFGNRSLFAAFLGSHHPGLSQTQLAQLSEDKLVKIPDLMTFDPPRRTEFYEIKPNSSSGCEAGRTKVARIHALCQSFGLPYVPGTQWMPDTRINLFTGRLLNVQVEVNFHFFLLQPGLLVYEICAESRARPLTNAEIAAIVALVLLALLATAITGGAAEAAAAALLLAT